MRPGSRWRVLAHKKKKSVELEDEGVFDELVVDDWIHIEQMSKRRWWMNIGGVTLWVRVNDEGRPLMVDIYGPDSYADSVPGCEYQILWRRGDVRLNEHVVKGYPEDPPPMMVDPEILGP